MFTKVRNFTTQSEDNYTTPPRPTRPVSPNAPRRVRRFTIQEPNYIPPPAPKKNKTAKNVRNNYNNLSARKKLDF